MMDPSAKNRRMRKELRILGYKDVSLIPLDKVSLKLLYLMTCHFDRVMKATAAGKQKLRREAMKCKWCGVELANEQFCSSCCRFQTGSTTIVNGA